MILLIITTFVAFLMSFGFLYLYNKKAPEIRKMNGLLMFSFILGVVSIMKLIVNQADGMGISFQSLAGLLGIFSFWFWRSKSSETMNADEAKQEKKDKS